MASLTPSSSHRSVTKSYKSSQTSSLLRERHFEHAMSFLLPCCYCKKEHVLVLVFCFHFCGDASRALLMLT